MVRIGLMASRIFLFDRRALLRGVSAGLGAAVATPVLPRMACADAPQRLALQAKDTAIGLRPGQPETHVWSLQASSQQASPSMLRFKPGQLDVAFQNDLPASAVLNLRGIDGVPAAEPLIAQAPLAPGTKAGVAVALRHPGTFAADLRLLGDGQAAPSRPLALVVEESDPPTVDRDEVLLIEDWLLRTGGAAVAPGSDPGSNPGDAATTYTVNGLLAPEIGVRSQQRLRLRLINGCQRAVIAVKMEGFEVRVMALDSRPAEPFAARNSALVLAPGGRADALIDITVPPGTSSPILLHDGKEAHPIARLVTSAEPPVRQVPLPPAAALPSTGLAAQLDLKNAMRVELALGGPEWVAPLRLAASAAPAFAAKGGRTVVLALANRADRATVFHLHGHHFRLLDRLDDGWKPFWLDTLAIEPGQTQRIAFLAEHAGRFLLESVGTDWTAPRLVRLYSVG
jgi:FtsP/CotA-like multicopper oxidase with cupredoxin domain